LSVYRVATHSLLAVARPLYLFGELPAVVFLVSPAILDFAAVLALAGFVVIPVKPPMKKMHNHSFYIYCLVSTEAEQGVRFDAGYRSLLRASYQSYTPSWGFFTSNGLTACPLTGITRPTTTLIYSKGFP